MFLLRRKPQEPPLLPFTRHDGLTLHDAHSGILALGATGSGKTSTLFHLFGGFMDRGCGMLFLTAKADDCLMIRRLARERGRKDVHEFGPDKPHLFDPVDFEVKSRFGGVSSAVELVGG